MRPDWILPKYDEDKLDLSNNVCYDPIVESAIKKALPAVSLRQYPDEYILYSEIAKYHNINPKTVVLGFGLGELIDRILKHNRHKKIAIVSPTWPMVEIYCKLNNIEHVLIDSIHDKTDADILYFANPSGIDGTALPREEVLDAVTQYELAIVDEAYGEFSNIAHSLLWDASMLPNVIVTKSLSKTLGVAGLRIGYAVANLEIINELQLIRPNSVANNVSVALAPLLFKLIPAHVVRMKITRSWLESTFNCTPSNGNYVLFNELPVGIIENFKIKQVDDKYRMALTNLHIIRDAISI